MNQYRILGESWNLFKLSKKETSGNLVTVIGILDASGSMSSCI